MGRHEVSDEEWGVLSAVLDTFVARKVLDRPAVEPGKAVLVRIVQMLSKMTLRLSASDEAFGDDRARARARARARY